MLAIAIASCAILRTDDAVASLAQAKMFAFGGVGVAGTPSDGQLLFNRVMASSDALDHFRGLVKNGDPAGRLYALCGLKALDKDAYAAAASTMMADSGATVEAVAGCQISHPTVPSVVAQIKNGEFDKYLGKKRAE